MRKILSFLVLLALIPSTAVAQITPDSSLGAEKSIVDSNGDRDTISGGAIRDTNLFHSFQEFNVGAGREAYFANPNGIANIFSRVTGNNLSNILGTLGVLGDANLFFMNPNGIVFGANARLDVRGSFLGSTADSLVFENGFEFSASNSQAPPLLTIGIPFGLNFRDNPGDIVNQSVANNGNGLEVATGETITLVGGNVDLDGGKIFAGGGRVELGGLSAAGEIGINADGSLSFPDGVARADVTLTNGSEVDVRAGGGGSIDVNARNVELFGGESGISLLLAGIATDSDSLDAQAGDIILNATDTITVSQGSAISNQVSSTGVGNSGGINITTTNLSLLGGGRVDASTFGVGNSGGIDITTTNLSLLGGSVVDASTLGVGDAGGITIKANGTIIAEGENSRGFPSGIASEVGPKGVGNSGRIDITTANLSLLGGGTVSARTFGVGDAGRITIKANGTIIAEGENSRGSFPSGIFSQVSSTGVGNSGGIDITTANLSILGGGQVETSTFGVGNAGGITIKANGNILAEGENSRGFPSGIFSGVTDTGVGNSGRIDITTANLSLLGGGQVDASTSGVGNAEAITIKASGTILAEGEDSGGFASGIRSQVTSTGEGNAGGIDITTTNLSLLGGGVVDASTFGVGDAGGITIKASGTISAEGEDSRGFNSGIFSIAGESGKGDAEDMNINTNNLFFTEGAEISVESLGQGEARNLFIQANSIALEKGASLFASTPVGTGGSIELQIADNLTLRDNSTISARATENANGGNIDIDAEFIIAFPNQNNDIIASASGGDGGEINITAEAIFGIQERQATPGNNTNDIDASSEFGLSGVVEINQPDVDPSQGLVELPETVVDPNALVAQNPCKRGSESEFVITGRGGLPPSLSEDLSSDATQVGLVEPAPMGAREQGSKGVGERISSYLSVPTTIIPAQGWIFNDKGEIVLVAYNPHITGSQRLKESLTGCPISGRN